MADIIDPEVVKFVNEKLVLLEKVYLESTLQAEPDESRIKQLLIDCLEHHYGSLDKCIVNTSAEGCALKEIKQVLSKYNV